MAAINGPNAIVLSGDLHSLNEVSQQLTNDSIRFKFLKVSHAFHSPLMEPAKLELEKAINETNFRQPICPVYQNVNAKPFVNSDEIKKNLIAQLTAPVRWTQTIQQMIADGATLFTEVGPGKVLAGLIGKIDKEAVTANA